GMAEHREVDMRRPPVIAAIRPGIGARPYGAEMIVAIVIGDGAPAAAEIRVKRREVSFAFVPVAAGGVGLPELDQRAGHRPGILVKHLAIDDEPLADGLAA